MSVLPWIFIAATVLPVSFLVWSLISVDSKSRLIIQDNLVRGTQPVTTGTTRDDRTSFATARRLTPTGYQAKLDAMLARAGRPANLPLGKILAAKPLLGLTGAAVGLLLVTLHPGALFVLLALGMTTLCYFVPDLLLISKGQERQKAIQLQLPDTLDQMLIAVEAGLGFEGALAKAAENGKGPLAEELVRTLQDLQMGRPRRDAYEALAERSTVPDLKSFVRAVVQADSYGIAIAKVLRTQAGQMRVKRRQRAEEKAMKLPVYVLFPLLFFIFPVLFIIIMGPAVINIIGMFTGGTFSH